MKTLRGIGVSSGYAVGKAIVIKEIKRDLSSAVYTTAEEEIKKFQTSSLITRTTNDIGNVEMMLTFGLQMIIKAPITAVWAVTKILNTSLYSTQMQTFESAKFPSCDSS